MDCCDSDFIICDNLIEFIEEKEIDSSLFQKCRNEAIQLAKKGLLKEAGFGGGKNQKVDKKVRCDSLMWLSNLDKNDTTTLYICKLIAIIKSLESLISYESQ